MRLHDEVMAARWPGVPVYTWPRAAATLHQLRVAVPVQIACNIARRYNHWVAPLLHNPQRATDITLLLTIRRVIDNALDLPVRP